MKNFIKDNLFLITITILLLLGAVSMTRYLHIQKKQAEIKLVQDVFFSGCIEGNSTDLEYRRTCGRAAKAYANGHLDYKAYGQTLTWDEEARLYVIKGEVK
jgi:hypothetical protein